MAYDLSVIDRYTLQYRYEGTTIIVDVVDTLANNVVESTPFINAVPGAPIPNEITSFGRSRITALMADVSSGGGSSIGGGSSKVNTIGLSKLVGNQSMVNPGSGLSAGVSINRGWVGKRELECDAQAGVVRVRAHILSRESINVSRNWQVAIAPTETAAVDTANNYFQPIVGGTVHNVVASNTVNTGDQYGYVQATFGGARKSGELYPAGLANQRVNNRLPVSYTLVDGIVSTDWMIMPVVPRSDVSPNGLTKAMMSYRISCDGVGVDTFSAFTLSFIDMNGYCNMASEYVQWLAGDTSARFNLCASIALAADYDCTNDFTKVPATTSPLSLSPNLSAPIIMWEVDYSALPTTVHSVLCVGDSMTEVKKADMQITAKVGDGTGATPTTIDGGAGNILTVSALANTKTKLLGAGYTVARSAVSTITLGTTIVSQLTSTEAGGVLGGTGTYQLSNSMAALASGITFAMQDGKSPKLFWKTAFGSRSKDDVIFDIANFGMSTNRMEMVQEVFEHFLDLGFTPTIMIMPDCSVNDWAPASNTRMIDWNQRAAYNEEVANLCQKLGIKLIMWTVPNFPVTGTNAVGWEGVDGRVKQIAHTRSMATRGLIYLADIQAAADLKTCLIDGTHFNAPFMDVAADVLGTQIDNILAGK